MFYRAGGYRVLLALAGLFMACSANASWNLSSDESHLYFVSVKNNDLVEVSKFTQLTGSIQDSGAARISVELGTVDTGIELRDERIREHLFQTEKFPLAVVEANVNPRYLVESAAPSISEDRQDIALQLHGIKKEMQSALQVIRLSDDRIMVNSLSPVLVRAEDFDLGGGVEMLTKLAGLKMIGMTVPVSFSLVFTRQ